jgi:methylmalonyl-CoA/ethylmalonyl-CoA epimerase
MNQVTQLRTEMGLPPPFQLGVIVRNMERAVDYYSSVFGIGPFTVYDFEPEKHWFNGTPSHLRLRMGKASWGGLELELLEPLEGKSLHREFLDANGEGVQHLGFLVSDYETVYDRFVKAGFNPAMRAETSVQAYNGYLKACYFDTRSIGGIIFEIIWRSWEGS